MMLKDLEGMKVKKKKTNKLEEVRNGTQTLENDTHLIRI